MEIQEQNINAIKFIHSVHDFVNEIKLLDKALENSQLSGKLFFRGQRNIEWNVHPSIFRNGWLNEESNMYSKLLLSSPSDFSNQKSAYEKLTKMQHYGLPTRLLDVTTNPLVALYFACEQNEELKDYEKVDLPFFEEDKEHFAEELKNELNNFYKEKKTYGEVFIVADEALEPDDDRITVLAELAHFCKEKKFSTQMFSMKIKPYTENDFDEEKLLQYLKEKPYRSVVSSMNNARIKAQSGAFIIFGIVPDENESDLYALKNRPFDIRNHCVQKIKKMRNDYLIDLRDGKILLDEQISGEDEDSNRYIKDEYTKLPLNRNPLFEIQTIISEKLYSYVIPPEYKAKILSELEQLGICHATIYPELEHQAKYIKMTSPKLSKDEPEDIDVILERISKQKMELEKEHKDILNAKESFNKMVSNKDTIIVRAIELQKLDNETEKNAIKKIKTDKSLFSQPAWFDFSDKIALNRTKIKKELRKIGISISQSDEIADLIVNKMIQVEKDKVKKKEKAGE